jgi:SNF2 family DNA or RNA helicase
VSLFEEVLFPYQREAAARIASQRRLLLADQPGLGKTLEVLGGLEVAGLFDRPSMVLILTPIINAKSTWVDAVERFVKPRYLGCDVVDVSSGSVKQKQAQFDRVFRDGVVFVVANHNSLDWTKAGVRVPKLGEIVWDAIVVDESHTVLPIRDHRKLTNFWKGLGELSQASDCLRVAVSGTPDRGKLENRYGTWRFLDAKSTPSNRWQWLEENFWVVEQKVSRTRSVRTVQSLKNERAWVAQDRLWMVRRTKAEVLPELPPKRYVDVELDLGVGQLSAYKVQQLESEQKLFDAKGEGRDSGEAMVFAIRARQLSCCLWEADDEGVMSPVVGGESVKLEWLLEWLSERGFVEFDSMSDGSAKVVIVSQFSKVLRWLQVELGAVGVVAEVLDGSTKNVDRARIQYDFQEGDLRVVLLSGTMGVGITLDAADDLVMFDSPYDPDRVEQIEDRVHRASNMHSVTIWNLVTVDTIEQAIMERLSKRYKTTRALLDGSRGVEFGRNVISMIRKEVSNGHGE